MGGPEALPETLRVPGAREVWYCHFALDAPDTDEPLATTYAVIVLRAGIASVTDLADVQRRALRSKAWLRIAARFSERSERRAEIEAHVLRAIALAYPGSVDVLRLKLAQTHAQS